MVLAVEPLKYRELRYTGFGIADPERDKKVIDDFKKGVEANFASVAAQELARKAALRDEAALRADPALKENAALRDESRRRELEAELASPLPANASRAEQLRRRARVNELERLKQVADANTSSAKPEAKPEPRAQAPQKGDGVIVLVDTLPEGVVMRDGRIGASGTTEIIGHFNARLGRATEETTVLAELKVLGEAAGGNLVVLSFHHSGEAQGRCYGAAGLIVRDTAFDPKKVTQGRLPSEI